MILIPDEVKSKIEDVRIQIESGTYTHRPKMKARSNIWTIFDEIIDDKENVVQHFYFCTKCHSIEYSYRSGGNTTQLLRHPCATPVGPSTVNIPSKDFQNLNLAAAKFVCLDFRPIYAVECPGLIEFVAAGFEIGKKYPTLKKDDFIANFPTRYLAKNCIKELAARAKMAIKVIFEESMKQGGFGCTLDLWTDNFKSNTYMAMTANVFLLRDTQIEQKRLVFHMDLVAEIVKSKDVIKERIINVFNDLGVGIQELKKYVTFTTDRYGTF